MAEKRKRRTKEEIEAGKRKKDAETARRQKVAKARGERKVTRSEIRKGEKRARETFRRGNQGCRTRRRQADAPHRAALKKNRMDYDACRRAVEGETVAIVSDLVPYEQRLRELDAMIPAPIPNPRAGQRQSQWEERLQLARQELERDDPALALVFDRTLGAAGKFGSKAARNVRALTDRMSMGRPVMTLREYVLKAAHDSGYTPEGGFASSPSLSREAQSLADRDVAALMLAGPPVPPGSQGPASLADFVASVRGGVPSVLPASAFSFPPPSTSPGVVGQILSAIPSSRGPSSRGRSGPASRAPRTQASPGSGRPSMRAASTRPKRSTKPKAAKGSKARKRGKS